MNMINLDKKRMNVVETTENGVVNHKTIFTFNQNKHRVYARYEGGQVKRGMLVGEIKGSCFKFNYTQVHEDGKVEGGKSTCTISNHANGKLILIENFDWNQGQGRNVFQEIE